MFAFSDQGCTHVPRRLSSAFAEPVLPVCFMDPLTKISRRED